MWQDDAKASQRESRRVLQERARGVEIVYDAGELDGSGAAAAAPVPMEGDVDGVTGFGKAAAAEPTAGPPEIEIEWSGIDLTEAEDL